MRYWVERVGRLQKGFRDKRMLERGVVESGMVKREKEEKVESEKVEKGEILRSINKRMEACAELHVHQRCGRARQAVEGWFR